jgi:hypothetical protein
VADERIAFCKVDAHLDTNPKVRRAGRDGRDVFEFLLRRVAIAHTYGEVPVKFIEAWYLADMLMMSEDEARHGVSQAVTARLIEIDATAGLVRIVGWGKEWGFRYSSDRMAEKRERDKEKSNAAKSDKPVTISDAPLRDVTVSDACDAREEKREEESIRAPADSAGLKALREKVSKAAKLPSKGPLPSDWEPNDSHLSKASSLGVDARREAEQFRNSALANGRRYANWDSAFHTWIGNAAKWRDERGGSRGAVKQQRIAAPESDDPELGHLLTLGAQT